MSFAHSREFKNTDESKSFEGHFISLENNIVKILSTKGIEQCVLLEKLSVMDQKWVKAAAMVVSKSKKNAAFRVVHVAKDGTVLIRLSKDPNRLDTNRDAYQGEFLLVSDALIKASEMSAGETYVRDLYWYEIKKIDLQVWKFWYHNYYGMYPYTSDQITLGNYFTSLEPAVDKLLQNQS